MRERLDVGGAQQVRHGELVHREVALDRERRQRRHARSRSSLRRILPEIVFGSDVDELDLARVLVRRRDRLDVLLQLARERVRALVPGREDDERLDDARALGIGLADDGRLGHRRMLDERRLDLERADAVRGRDDDVVGAADEPEVAVLVLRRAVAREVPAVVEHLGVGVVVAPVALHQADRPLGLGRERDVALLARARAARRRRETTSTSLPGVGLPIEPGRTSRQGKLATRLTVSVCP